MEQKIQAEIKAAMLAKNSVRLAALRGVKAAILLAKTAEGASGELSDGDILKIIQKLVKQRKESAAIYTEQNRPDLAEAELAEVQELEGFLPKALTEEEIEAKVREVIAQVGASSMADMGKVMGVATEQLAGQADGRAISAAVKKCLS
jgi:uncharacterized protein YqeY